MAPFQAHIYRICKLEGTMKISSVSPVRKCVRKEPGWVTQTPWLPVLSLFLLLPTCRCNHTCPGHVQDTPCISVQLWLALDGSTLPALGKEEWADTIFSLVNFPCSVWFFFPKAQFSMVLTWRYCSIEGWEDNQSTSAMLSQKFAINRAAQLLASPRLISVSSNRH